MDRTITGEAKMSLVALPFFDPDFLALIVA